MPQNEIVLTNDDKVQLTQIELEYFESFIKAGDRGGFYLAYYNMTGSHQALSELKGNVPFKFHGGDRKSEVYQAG